MKRLRTHRRGTALAATAVGLVCNTTEVSDAAYKPAMRKAAVALAKQMVADLREILAAAQVDFGLVLRRPIETARITGQVQS